MISTIGSLLDASPLSSSLTVALAALSLVLLFTTGYAVYNLTLHPLADVPGPILARALPFYPLWLYYNANFSSGMKELHAKYGDFVRLTPNHVAVGQKTSLKNLWTTKGFEKGDFYDSFSLGISKHRDLFTIRDNTFHGQRKRITAHVFTMTSVLQCEQYIDSLVELFLVKMGRFADRGEIVDVGLWTWRFSYDIIGELFFGIAYGFLEQERDIDNLMATTGAVAPFEAMMGMAPAWLRPFTGLGIVVPNIARGIINFKKVAAIGKNMVAKRLEEIKEGKQGRSDMLGKLLNVVEEKGEKYDFSVHDVEQECFVAMIAGNDTVSIMLTIILWHLAAHPESARLLQKELDEATISPMITYKEALDLPYLMAVVNEGFRIHPLFGYPVPRVVPEGGAEACGRFWPAGTYLGTSCGVPEMNKEVFGEDAESWRPDRWIVDKQQAARMWDEVCAFGIGNRACIGQHIARTEIVKLVASFLRDFDLEAKSGWQSFERWFNKPQDIKIKVTRRSTKAA